MRAIQVSIVATLLSIPLDGPAAAGDESPPKGRPSAPAAAEKCGHGVKRAICTRCNPKLEAVFKAKGDWCAEHSVPESRVAHGYARISRPLRLVVGRSWQVGKLGGYE